MPSQQHETRSVRVPLSARDRYRDNTSLSYRDVEELLAERGLDISYESVRSWVLKFGPAIARALRGCRPQPSDRWHLDEMVVRIAGRHMYLWRAVDHEGEVLEILVQRRREKRAAIRLIRNASCSANRASRRNRSRLTSCAHTAPPPAARPFLPP